MSANQGSAATKAHAYVYNWAAWYSLLVPVVSPVCGFVLIPITNAHLGIAMGLAFWIFVSSFICGIVSLFGVGRRGPASILWKAGAGVLLSGILGFLAYAYWNMSHSFHG